MLWYLSVDENIVERSDLLSHSILDVCVVEHQGW